MLPHELIEAKKDIAIARLVFKERRPPPARAGIRLRPQYLRWEVGSYRERLRSGPGGIGRTLLWAPRQVGEQHNLVLDQAFELMAVYGIVHLMDYAVVGTGSDEPSVSDTALAAELARTDYSPEGDRIDRTAPGQYLLTRVREFDAATVGGHNLTEWGWSPSGEANSGNLAVRELFRDANGDPVALSLASDQNLRLIYAYSVSLAPIRQTVTLNITNIGTVSAELKLFHYYSIGIDEFDRLDLDLFDRILKGETIYAFVDDLEDPGWTYDSNVADWATIVEKEIVPDPYVAGSRSRSVPAVTFEPYEANINISRYALKLESGEGAADSGAQLWFENPIVKDDLHKLIFDPWTVTW